MGWFWSDAPIAKPQSSPHGFSISEHGAGSMVPPPGCPMHQKSADTIAAKPPATCPVDHSSFVKPAPPASGCPVPHGERSAPDVAAQEPQSLLSKINPLNYMFSHISQAPAPNQTHALPTDRENSTIPKGDGSGANWEYPSPQQMYNALLRKGYADTDVTAVESMVSVHNFLNEGAWAEILEWEKRFGQGLWRGLQVCSKGEENVDREIRRLQAQDRKLGNLPMVKKEDWEYDGPSLMRFQGRPKDMTPKAAMIQVLGWIYPAKFGGEPPFDRHDWFVSREINGQKQEVRYVIDYYEGDPEPNGDPVFYLDVRPAATPSGAAERIIRYTSDVWWRASGGDVREGARKISK